MCCLTRLYKSKTIIQLITLNMAAKRGKRKKVQRGETSPFFVDFKKGIEVTKSIAKKSVCDFKGQDRRGKKRYANMKANYRKYKSNGGGKRFNEWAKATGQTRKPTCTIM